MITGKKVERPTKAALAAGVAAALQIDIPHVSSGSSIDSEFLDALHVALSGDPTGASDTYRKTELVLDRLGLTYDPYWDTSESAEKGGGTVTTRAYSRIRTAITERPRCFILNVTDAPVGARWERNHAEVYRYDDTVTGRMPLNDAGPGSRIVYYATGKSKEHPKHFIATATVAYIDPGWTGPWEARLQDYHEFSNPVAVDEFELAGWNRQHAITEISYETYEALVAEGAPQGSGPDPTGVGHWHEPDVAEADLGGADVAHRVLVDFPVDEAKPTIAVPGGLPATVPTAPAPIVPLYEETPDGVQPVGTNGAPPQSRNQARDKLAEKRAVDLVIKALKSAGWQYTRDRQKDGVGYDLEFEKADPTLKVEVKGIQGPRLTFNLTPKEFWRAETDSEWVLVAVTSVLAPSSFQLHFLTRDRIVAAQRTVTGYRVRLSEVPSTD